MEREMYVMLASEKLKAKFDEMRGNFKRPETVDELIGRLMTAHRGFVEESQLMTKSVNKDAADRLKEYQAMFTGLAAKVEQFRDRHGNPNGTDFEQGQWDMAQRIISALKEHEGEKG